MCSLISLTRSPQLKRHENFFSPKKIDQSRIVLHLGDAFEFPQSFRTLSTVCNRMKSGIMKSGREGARAMRNGRMISEFNNYGV